MTDTSYHMAIWIGIGIRIGVGKTFSSCSYLVLKVSGKSGIGPLLVRTYWLYIMCPDSIKLI